MLTFGRSCGQRVMWCGRDLEWACSSVGLAKATLRTDGDLRVAFDDIWLFDDISRD